MGRFCAACPPPPSQPYYAIAFGRSILNSNACIVISPLVPLAYYSLLIIAASVVGGMIPTWVKLTHRGMQLAVSFVAAMMFGVGMLHMLPHALAEAQSAANGVAGSDASGDLAAMQTVMLWAMGGWLAMFFIERFFCFHHHDVDTDEAGHFHDHDEHCHHDAHEHHDVTWSGAALGLTLHSVIEGVALATSVLHGHGGSQLAGFGAFLVIFLHKPFDSMTIAMLMARGGWPAKWRLVVNGLFAAAIPLGVAIFYVMYSRDASSPAASSQLLEYALAFSAGTFLCISLSDLLPELQFHDHDRVALSASLLAGLALSIGVGRLESLVHKHPPAASAEVTR